MEDNEYQQNNIRITTMKFSKKIKKIKKVVMTHIKNLVSALIFGWKQK